MTHVTRFAGLGAAAALLLAPTAGPVSAETSYGHTRAPDGRLRDGCHNYSYSYTVDTPTDDWSLEIFLKDPAGRSLASGVKLSDSDPRHDRGHFRFCRYSTRPGTFTIKATVHWYDANNEEHKAKFTPSHFRLGRR